MLTGTDGGGGDGGGGGGAGDGDGVNGHPGGRTTLVYDTPTGHAAAPVLSRFVQHRPVFEPLTYTPNPAQELSSVHRRAHCASPSLLTQRITLLGRPRKVVNGCVSY
jgi:hypothetical protein